MKKLAILIIAMTCTAMFCAPAFADDRVSFYGSMRVEAQDSTWFDGSESSNWDQRFRLGTKVRVSDDVYTELRVDWAEAKWGQDFNTSGLIVRPARGTASAIDIDRAFLNIDKEMWALRAGLQYMGLGILQVLDANATGVRGTLRFNPVTATLLYAKMDENGSTNDDNDADDEDMYGLNLNYSCDAFSADFFAATVNDGTSVDYSPVALGIHATASLGIVDLIAEIANFSGDTNGGATDITGTQLFIEADAKISDAFTVEGQLLYATGTTDANEVQVTGLSNWWSFTPMQRNTPFDAWHSFAPTANIFDPSDDSAGVQGIVIGGKFVPMEDLSLGGKVGYFSPEEDDATTLDDITSFYVWASYSLATNTTLGVMYLHSDPSVDGTHAMFVDGEAYKQFLAKLQVGF